MGALAHESRVVERGPNWLFVRVSKDAFKKRKSSHSSKTLIEQLWELSSKHFTYRLVLELQDVDEIDEQSVDDLRKLRLRLTEQGGALRLCGMPSGCSKKLRKAAQKSHLDDHESRHEAVCGDSGEWFAPAPQPKHSEAAVTSKAPRYRIH